MSDPIATTNRWLAATLFGSTELTDLIGDRIFEDLGDAGTASPFLVITWRPAVPFRTFADEAMWTVYVNVSSVAVGEDVSITDLEPVVNAVHTALTTAARGPIPGGGRFIGCVRTGQEPSFVPAETARKRESTGLFKVTVCP